MCICLAVVSVALTQALRCNEAVCLYRRLLPPHASITLSSSFTAGSSHTFLFFCLPLFSRLLFGPYPSSYICLLNCVQFYEPIATSKAGVVYLDGVAGNDSVL